MAHLVDEARTGWAIVIFAVLCIATAAWADYNWQDNIFFCPGDPRCEPATPVWRLEDFVVYRRAIAGGEVRTVVLVGYSDGTVHWESREER